MSKIELMPHQVDIFEASRARNRVAYYLDMGLGKTFLGSEKMMQLGNTYRLVICQKSKVADWVEHFKTFYPNTNVIDYTKPKAKLGVGTIIVNYELAWRRPELASIPGVTLMLDESSMIQNETAKRSRFILHRLNVKDVILLSGTPTAGKYEKLWSQCRLLGWNISKHEFYSRYVIEVPIMNKKSPFPIKIVVGYKNVEELKTMLRYYGAYFLKTEDVLSLPAQTFVNIDVPTTPQYRKYHKDKIVEVDGTTLVGDITLKRVLHERQLCGMYCKAKLEAFADLLDSTDDRLIVFYNFTEELNKLMTVAKGRPISVVNGARRDLTAYETKDNSVTFIQYQAGSMGLNLQKANKIVYFTLPLSSEHFEQSKKRTHRIGQKETCFYYTLVCKGSIEEKIMATLKQRRDYTDRLFEEELENESVKRKIKA